MSTRQSRCGLLLPADPVAAAALWLASTKLKPGENAVVVLKAKFGLCSKATCEAIREAALIRARAH